MTAAIILALFLSAQAEAKLVKSVTLKPNEVVSRETLPMAKACEGKERKCQDGSRAGLVLPTCDLVCPEDGRKDLSCFQGMAGESEFTWEEEREIPGTPVIYSEGERWNGPVEHDLNCTVFQLVKEPSISAEAFRRPASHQPSRVAPAQ